MTRAQPSRPLLVPGYLADTKAPYPIVRDRRGELVTPNMLPSLDDRWTPRKRELAQLAISGGLITLEQALALWRMTYEELDEWGIRTENSKTAKPVALSNGQLQTSVGFERRRMRLNSTDRLILDLLSSHAGRVVTPRMIGRAVYAKRAAPKARTIDVFIMRLRRRLKAHQARVTVRTIWGRGYLLCDLASFDNKAVA